MLKVEQGSYTLLLADGCMPSLREEYAKHATLFEEVEYRETADGDWFFFAIEKDGGWPFLVVTMRYSPASGVFNPGVLLVPETSTLFVGAGGLLLAYDLATPRRLWQDKVDAGFWGWKVHGNVVVMSAEMEIAAWSDDGTKKLWSHYADPPWTYEIKGRTVNLKADSFAAEFDLYKGS